MFLIISRITLLSLISIVFLGGFSRFTHGAYTPSFHTYQRDRAPDNENTWLIPVLDTILGTLLLFSKTRPWAAFLCALGQGAGVWMRVQEGEEFTKDVGFFSLALLVFATSTSRRWDWTRYIH